MYVPVLHDEVSTYLIYIKSGNFWPHTAWPDANNHILNSFAVHKMYEWFGSSPFVLRLPNLLSWVLFSASVAGIASLLRDEFLKFGFVSVMFLTHGFIEFFAFARGYGMSMAFLLFSLWMLLEMNRKQSGFHAAFVLLGLMLSVLANLTLLPSALMIVIYTGIVYFRKIKFYKKWSIILSGFFIIAFLIFFLYFLGYSLKLKSMNLLYYGGEEGFFNAILKTHGQMLFNNTSQFLLWAVVAVFAFIMGLFVIECFRNSFRRIFEPSVTLFPFLLVSSLVVILVMHFFMGVNYPEDRTSIFLYPYFIGYIFFTSDALRFRWKRWILIPLMYIPFNFVFHINSAYSFQWYYERIPAEFSEIVASNSGERSPSDVTISGYKIHEQIWGFHVAAMNNGVNLINPASYPNNMDDFILLRKQEADTMPGYFDDYIVLAEDKYSGVRLLKRREFLPRNFLFEKNVVAESEVTMNEFIEFFPDTVFDFCGRSLVFEFDVQFEDGFGPRGSVFVVSVRDSVNNNLQYERLETDWMFSKQVSELHYSLSVLNIPQDAAGMVVYIWNKHKRPLRIKQAKLRVYELG